MSTNFVVVIILKKIHVSNHHIVYFKITQVIGQLCLNKAGKMEKKNTCKKKDLNLRHQSRLFVKSIVMYKIHGEIQVVDRNVLGLCTF